MKLLILILTTILTILEGRDFIIKAKNFKEQSIINKVLSIAEIILMLIFIITCYMIGLGVLQ